MSRQAGGQNYDFTVPANGSFPIAAVGSYFRIISSGGALTVRMNGTSSLLKGMIAGQGVQGQDFLSLELFNTTAAAISGVMFVGDGGFFDLNLAVTGGLAVRPEAYSAYTNVLGVLAINTADQVVAPAANTNGIILQNAYFYDYTAGQLKGGLLAKNAAPTAITDGVPVGEVNIISITAGALVQGIQQPERSIMIPAGLGLYWYFDAATSAVSRRTTRYKLL